MKELNASPGKLISIGYEGEDKATKIVFRYDEEWLVHGNGVFKIRVLRRGDTEAYNATQVVDDREAMTLTMTVTDIELSVKGHGEMQVVYIGADFVKKSPVYRYNVSRAIDSVVVDPPESSVINEIIESLAGIKDEIGTLDSLTTTDKSDLVSAINEVNVKEVTVDSELSGVSENPVQNKVIKARFDGLDQTVAGISGRLSTAETTLEGKANTADVNTALSTKANTSDVNTALSVKADKSYVDTELADKANSTDVNTALSAKANSSDVNNALDLKADTADMNTALALKANSADVQTALAGKADKTYVDAEINSVQEDLNSKAPAVLESVSGSVVSFEDGAELPAESVIAHIEPQQDLHGYDNPWPAGGGKNLLDPSTASALGNTVWFCEPNGFLFKGGVSYTFSVSNSDDVSSIAIYSTDKSTQLAYSTGSTRQSVTYTPTEDTYGLPRLYRTTAITQAIVDGTMIEIGSVRTTFAPYSNICPITGWTGATIYHSGEDITNPTTYSITFPTEAGIVYGGSLDVTKGVLTVDRAILDMGTLSWNYFDTATHPYFMSRNEITRIKPSVGNTIIHPLICSMYKTETWSHTVDTSDYDASICLGWSGKSYVAVRDSRYTTLEEFTTAINGVELCYELATPVTYNISPQEIMTLLGTNTIWPDTGDIDVEYRADTKAYIEAYIDNNIDVSDVQVNGMSIVTDGVAEIPIASRENLGTVKVVEYYGVTLVSSGTYKGAIALILPSDSQLKAGENNSIKPSVSQQHKSTFYGLAKASGDTTQSASSNAVGTYTETAKSKISDMLNGAVSVSGTTPTITALSGVRYICGEVATLDITPCVSGICDIVFTSGSTATVLTLPNTVKFPDGAFTPEANTTYEINIMDGIYGVVAAWT